MRIIIATAALALLSVSGYGQLSKPKFGINAGLNISNVKSSEHSPLNNYVATVSNGVGYRLGLLMDWALIKNLAFSPKAELSLNNARVAISGGSGDGKVYEVYPVTTELAGHFTYKLFKNGITPYLLAGPNYKIPLTDNKTRYATKKPVLCADFGAGLELKFRKFDFAPELRYSLAPAGSTNIDEIGKLNANAFVLAVNFKGK